jgi:hypothetical protein
VLVEIGIRRVKASAYLSTVPSVSLNDFDNMSDKGLLIVSLEAVQRY